MNVQQQDFKALIGTHAFTGQKIRLSPKDPIQVAKEIIAFRVNFKDVDLRKAMFLTYDLNNMLIGMGLIGIVRDQWEEDNAALTATHEIALSVYPAMEIDGVNKNKLNFYFIPTWIKKGSFDPGNPLGGTMIDFAKVILDPADPYCLIYPDTNYYIFDLGSSCP